MEIPGSTPNAGLLLELEILVARYEIEIRRLRGILIDVRAMIQKAYTIVSILLDVPECNFARNLSSLLSTGRSLII